MHWFIQLHITNNNYFKNTCVYAISHININVLNAICLYIIRYKSIRENRTKRHIKEQRKYSAKNILTVFFNNKNHIHVGSFQ